MAAREQRRGLPDRARRVGRNQAGSAAGRRRGAGIFAMSAGLAPLSGTMRALQFTRYGTPAEALATTQAPLPTVVPGQPLVAARRRNQSHHERTHRKEAIMTAVRWTTFADPEGNEFDQARNRRCHAGPPHRPRHHLPQRPLTPAATACAVPKPCVMPELLFYARLSCSSWHSIVQPASAQTFALGLARHGRAMSRRDGPSRCTVQSGHDVPSA
jgi:hypothetical protein